MNNVIILEKQWIEKFEFYHGEIKTPMEYILSKEDCSTKRTVINLSSHLDYQDEGYYVSLLAMARNDEVFPKSHVLQDLKDRVFQKLLSAEILQKIQDDLKRVKDDHFELSVYLGKNVSSWYDDICWELFKIIKAPMFRVYFEKTEQWNIKKMKLLSMGELWPSHLAFLNARINTFFEHKKKLVSSIKNYKYDIAILVNPEEFAPPSSNKAIKAFVRAGKNLGLRCDVIEYKKDKPNIAEYDGLFIRETTNVNHHTYKLARRAEKEGLVVIDDSNSIIKCSNKIFMEQLMDRLHVKRPRTIFLHKENFRLNNIPFEFPAIIKMPDSAFSQGVFKVKSMEDLKQRAEELFKKSDLILMQEYLPTDYDWRVGILNNEILFVCKYYMVEGHWQIVQRMANNKLEEGRFDNINPAEVDPAILKTALKVTRTIGTGLYGVDLKQKGKDVYLIEVNDNPNLDYGVEDQFLGEKLYESIMKYFLDKINEKRNIGTTDLK